MQMVSLMKWVRLDLCISNVNIWYANPFSAVKAEYISCMVSTQGLDFEGATLSFSMFQQIPFLTGGSNRGEAEAEFLDWQINNKKIG